MCSNKNNNRRHDISYYVVEQGGAMVDRTRVTDPVLRVAGMPEPVEQPALAAAIPLAAAAAIPQAPIPQPDQPRVYQPIPAFDARATIAARRETLRQLAQANAEAIRADRLLRRQHERQVRKLRSHTAARNDAALLVQLPPVARSNVDGLIAARQLTAQQAPRQIFGQDSIENKCRQYGNNPLAHRLVKANIWQHSTMMTTVDLRDDEIRAYNGQTIRRGAVWEPETALHATKVNLQIYVEQTGNQKRARREFRRLARYCPSIESLHVEVIGENNLPAAQEISQILAADFEDEKSGFDADIAIEFTVSLYESEDA